MQSTEHPENPNKRVGKQQINIYDYENKNVIDHFGDFMEFGANN